MLFKYITLFIISQFQRMIEKHMWRTVNTANPCTSKPSPRWGHSCCLIHDQVIFFGGYADSIYMNDLWAFNTKTMQWNEIKTTGEVPSPRSNCSLTYDSLNNRVIMFGGGGSNKTRYNTINILDWNTKVWTQIAPQENEAAPWERTYHSAELLYPYLVVFGGEGIADLDDLWLFNFETLRWLEVPIAKNSVKPCPRRFHSSCIIGNTFFVIAGCHSKYRCLNDIYSIDLSQLIQTGNIQDLSWKQCSIKGYSFLTRWGHASAAHDGKIYTFGGRFSNDLNDLLVFDPEKNQLKALKVSPDSLPKPRRRPTTCFVGSCLLMFGGFNQDYYNDLHYINVGISQQRPKKKSIKVLGIQNYVFKAEEYDHTVFSCQGEAIPICKGLLAKNFHEEDHMVEFLQRINHQQSKQNLEDMMRCLYAGFGKNKQFYRYGVCIPSDQQEKEINLLKYLDQMRESTHNTSNILPKSFKRIKVSNNAVVTMTDEHYGDFLEKNREKMQKDCFLIVNDHYKLEACSIELKAKSQFFKNLLSTKFDFDNRAQRKLLRLFIPGGNIVLLEIILNFLLLNYLVVPESMNWKDWLQIYEIADYMSLLNLKELVVCHLESLVNQQSIEGIFQFAQDEKINGLAMICAQVKIKTSLEKEPVSNNSYILKALELNRFDFNQGVLLQQQPSVFKKKSWQSADTEGEKENFEVSNS